MKVYVCPRCGNKNLWEGPSSPKKCEFCGYEFGTPIEGREDGRRRDIEIGKSKR